MITHPRHGSATKNTVLHRKTGIRYPNTETDTTNEISTTFYPLGVSFQPPNAFLCAGHTQAILVLCCSNRHRKRAGFGYLGSQIQKKSIIFEICTIFWYFECVSVECTLTLCLKLRNVPKKYRTLTNTGNSGTQIPKPIAPMNSAPFFTPLVCFFRRQLQLVVNKTNDGGIQLFF